MKFVAISVETTGMDPVKCDILECGFIVENTKNQLSYEEAPKLRFWVDKEYYRGNPFALSAQCPILNRICELRNESSKRLIKPDDICDKISNFLKPHFAENGQFKSPVVVAGFNYASVGRRFLSKLKGFDGLPLEARSLEVHNQFIDWDSDGGIASFAKCRELAGIEGPVVHDSLQTAWDTIRIFRTKCPNNLVKVN